MDDVATSWLLDEEEKSLSASIEEFQERAKGFAVMANIAAMHGLMERAKVCVRAAAANVLAYGHHKDMLLFRVLDAIRACDSLGDSAKTESRQRLFRIAPMIGAILEFTDGDETRLLLTELGDALAQMDPELVPSYYDYLCDRRQYDSAGTVMRTILTELKFSGPFAKALAETATDDESLLVLKKRSEAGDQMARECFEAAREFFGDPQEESTGTGSGIGEPRAREEEKIRVADYPPESLAQLLQKSRSAGDWQGQTAVEWLDYWEGAGRGENALRAMEAAISQGEAFGTFSGVLDRVAALALKCRGKSAAYPWLVKAHVDSNGWSAYFTDTKQAEKRLKLIADLFPEKWFDFVRDTVFASIAAGWRSSAVWGEFLRLVEFCIVAGQPSRAREITEKAVAFAESLCSPVQLPKPTWIPSATD